MKPSVLGIRSVVTSISLVLAVGSGSAQTQTPRQITQFDPSLSVVDSVITQDASGTTGIGTTTSAAGLGVASGNLNVAGNVFKGGMHFRHSSGGFANTFLGQHPGNLSLTGYENTASGFGALQAATTGVANIANGDNALGLKTTRIDNTANGVLALANNSETVMPAGYQTVNGSIAVNGDTTVCGVMTPNTFDATGSMITPRYCHTATLLQDGRVLITGGWTSGLDVVTDSAELYIPSERTFISAGTMTTARSCHTATLLQDGRVLINGGSRDTTIAELYDPQTGTFTATGDANQVWGTATLLDSGEVLITGGANPELYDPTTETFTATGAFAGELSVSSASLLLDGRVLIAAEPTAELYDPETGTFSLTGAMTTQCFFGPPSYIADPTATVLMDGTVLVAGGANEDCGRFDNAELYDATAGTFAATGNMTIPRYLHTATWLPDGTVLIAGGETSDCGGFCFSGTTTSTELYAPSTGTFVWVGDMMDRRGGHSATLLNDGTVLIAGGYCATGIGQFCGILASAELYTPSVSGSGILFRRAR